MGGVLRQCRHVFVDFRLKWQRRRYLWRASFFYNCVSWVLIVGIALTFILHYFITKFTFFVNYNCSARSIKHITYYIVAQMILIGTILIITILLGRLCNLFSNYSLVNCTYSKRFIDVLGFTLKWLPSIGGVLMGVLITIQIIGLIWNQVNTRQWCVNRFNESAVNAVKNCRLIHQGRAACKLDFKVTIKKEIRNCNSAMYLSKKRIIYLALSDDDEECNIEDVSVCNAMQNVFTNKEVDWHVDQLKGCLGRLPKHDEALFDDRNPSDLYRYLVLSNIAGIIISTLIIVFFYVVRCITVFDAIIYQPVNANDNMCIKLMRPLTLWA
ncbi:hypothetical protein X943_001626 [Babesia divergens]|uniref:Uncharacterized protein n=1 Tax=Babesia divergens TaxID=32595 RepID=A0AAD9GAD1_BABDI|nr:hypothetical protein X943_001626 [Babesia divergens]